LAAREYRQLTQALKTALKTKKMTYAAVGKSINLSERSIKRILGGEDSSIGTLVDICEAVGIKFFDLLNLVNKEEEESYALSVEQEELLSTNMVHFAVYSGLADGVTPEMMLKKHPVTSKRLSGYLRDLERWGLLERHPGGRIKMTYRGSLNFRTGGPLSAVFAKKELHLLIDQGLQPKSAERVQFLTATTCDMTRETAEAFKGELEDVARRYRLRAQTDRAISAKENLVQGAFTLGVVAPFKSWYDTLRIE